MNTRRYSYLALLLSLFVFVAIESPKHIAAQDSAAQSADQENRHVDEFDQRIRVNAGAMVDQGRNTFRFDTFGDEAFWGDTLHLHQAIEGAKLGGVGPGVSPATALAVGLKVDVDALPVSLIAALKEGKVNLNDPASTLALLKLNSVVSLSRL